MTIKEIIEPFDKLSYTKFDEHDVSTSLRKLIPEDRNQIDEKLKAELMAFDFAEDYQDKKTGWGTYFGPMMVWNNEDGTATESPSIKLITPEMIDYWDERAKQSTNPIIIARYSGLVWDFKHKITGQNPSHETCRLYVKSLIDQANGDYHKYEVNTFRKLRRAIALCISLNDDSLIKDCKEAIINFEIRHSQDTKPGLWGYSFDLLIGNKRVSLTEEEENNIIQELEQKLSRLTKQDTEGQKIDPWTAEAAAERLGIYYRKTQKNEEVSRVILEVGKAFDKIIGDASAMQASGWLDHLHKLYTKFNLKEEAAQILLRIRELGPKVASELKPISHSFDLPKKEMDEYITAMTEGDIQTIIDRIAVRYIPIKEQVKEQIFDLSKKAPLTFLIGHQIQDEKGRVIATIGSLEDDLEGHIIRQVSQNLSFSSIFLRTIFQKSIDDKGLDRKSTRLNSSHTDISRMPSSA